MLITTSSHAIVNDVKINVALYNLIGRRRCSAVSRKPASKYLTASILALKYFFVRVLIETKVNISNELNFSDVYRNINYNGSLAKFT